MASVAECEAAFEQLAAAGRRRPGRKQAAFDRTLSCTLRDLESSSPAACTTAADSTSIEPTSQAQIRLR